MNEMKLEYPVDCILETDTGVVICSYFYQNGTRCGKIEHLNINSMEIDNHIETPGTLDAVYCQEIIYAANSSNVASYKKFELVKTFETSEMNTFILLDDFIYVSNTSGKIIKFDFDLNILEQIEITEEPIWIIKKYDNYLFIGDESGVAYRYDLTNKSRIKFGNKSEGIIQIFFEGTNILVSSYDGNIQIYDLHSLEFIGIRENTGALWRILKYCDFYISAAIYDGLKIFDSNFNLIYNFKTKSICYGLCRKGNLVFFSSFYESKIFWFNIDELIKKI